MNFTNVTSSMTRFGTAALRTLEHYAPKILVATGIACGVGATVTACKATLKLKETMEEINTEVDTAKSITAENPDEEKAKNKEVAKSYISGGLKLAKLYGPSVALGVAGAACVLSGNHMMNQRYAGAVAALTTSEKMFSDYRKCVVDELGADKDIQFVNGVKAVISEEPVLDKNGAPKTDKNGEVKTVKKTAYEGSPESNKYARMYDEINTNAWAPDPDYNRTQLLLKEQYFNDILHSQKYLFLNDVYKQLGYPITSYGQDVGWIIDDVTPDARVDLGLYDINTANGCRRIDDLDRYTNAIWLTFNGVRYIKDRVFRFQRVF